MTSQPVYYPVMGGLDQESPAISVPPGRVIAVLNHESVSQGYQRTQGYERFDGHPQPSRADFSVATFTDGDTVFVVGQTVTGALSGATARVLSAPILSAGAWDGTAEGSIALHMITGTFLTGEEMRVGGVPYALMNAPPVEGDGNSDDAGHESLIAAREYARSNIHAVPGSGPVRGVLFYQGKVHAWRDNAGGTAAVLHQSSGAGWTQPNLGTLLYFDAGSGEIAVGNTVTGSTSGATGVVRVISLDAGTEWGGVGGTIASGIIVLDSVAGVFQDNESLNVGGVSKALTNGVAAPATFPAGGRYEFEITNFYGSTGYERAYGVNGVGRAFEYNGSSILPISTGMPQDAPFLVAAHKNHLFLGFPGGSLQHSDLGEPRSFTARLGAAEIGMGHELTGIIPNAQATLLVTTDTSLAVLTGNDSSDWLLEGLSDEAGARRFTPQRIGQIIYLDNRGVRSVAATQSYGNFKLGTYTSLITKELATKRKLGLKPVASCVVKSKDQYLLFFSNGSGISIYFGRKNPEAMLFEYPFIPSCIHVAEDDGVERVFVGATNGFVYELNVGTSFDGAEIEAYLQLPFGHQGSPLLLKRYHKVIPELIARPGTVLSVTAQFDYGAGLQIYPHTESVGNVIGGVGGLWGSENWAEFFWDSPLVAQSEIYIQGVGSNMGLILSSVSTTMESYIIQGMTILFSPRGKKR